MTRLFRFVVSAIVPCLASTSHVDAAELIYTFNKPSATTTWNVPTTGVNYFDASLGTLLSVKIDIEATFAGSGTVTNDGVTPSDFEIEPRGRTAFTKSNLGTGSTLTPRWLLLDQSDASFIITNLAAGASAPFSFNYSGSTTTTLTLPADLASFTGSGQVPYYLKALASATAISENDSTVTQAWTSTGFLRVTYDYTPVPEPSTYVLATLGVLTLGALGRRTRRRK
jgi:hypothetical protein